MTEILIDASELAAFGQELTQVAQTDALVDQIKKLLGKQALQIKNRWRADLRSTGGFAVVAPAITSDIEADDSHVEVEIGPDKGRGGSLANIAMFGGSRGGGQAQPPEAHLAGVADQLEAALADMIGDML
jgi:hypothetical protein